MGSLLLKHQPNDTYRLIKPIHPPTAVANVLDLEISVRWLENVRSKLNVPVLDEDGIGTDSAEESPSVATTSETSRNHEPNVSIEASVSFISGKCRRGKKCKVSKGASRNKTKKNRKHTSAS